MLSDLITGMTLRAKPLCSIFFLACQVSSMRKVFGESRGCISTELLMSTSYAVRSDHRNDTQGQTALQHFFSGLPGEQHAEGVRRVQGLHFHGIIDVHIICCPI